MIVIIVMEIAQLTEGQIFINSVVWILHVLATTLTSLVSVLKFVSMMVYVHVLLEQYIPMNVYLKMNVQKVYQLSDCDMHL